MLKLLRNSAVSRVIAAYFIISLLSQVLMPTVAMALTSGPAQEEFSSFEPASTSDMVDLYTGDYNYNLPLLSVPGPNGGYPINISYHSGIGMEQEAGWVGLGWSLNVGAVNRQMRGLPDDFNGDVVSKIQHIKKNVTASLDIPTGAYSELVGFPASEATSSTGAKESSGSVSNNLQIYYNNYKGLGLRYSVGFSSESSPIGLNISSDSQNGMGIGLSFNAKNCFRKGDVSGGFSLGANYNSRQGLQGFNFTASAQGNTKPEHHPDEYGVDLTTNGTGGNSSSISFATLFSVPKTNMQMKSTSVPFTLRLGTAKSVFRFKSPVPISGSVYTSEVEYNGIDNVPALGYLYTNGSENSMKDFNRKDIQYSKKIPHLPSSSFTYDYYTQSGQGTGSMFRPHLNTFGVLTDPKKESRDRVKGGGLEVGLPFVAQLPVVSSHFGYDFQYGAGRNSSGAWESIGDEADYDANLQKLVVWESANDKIDYEPYYYQILGEKTGEHVSEDQLSHFGGDDAVRFKIFKQTHDNSWINRHFKAEQKLVKSETDGAAIELDGFSQTKQQPTYQRARRANSIETLTTAQARLYGFSKSVTYNDLTGISCPAVTDVNIVDKNFSMPAAHTSEMSMLQADGMRYVYGLPTYNNIQIDNVFAIDQIHTAYKDAPNTTIAAIPTTGSHVYGGVDVTGTSDEYVSKNTLPKYPNSWLLTSVLSSDYLDVTGNGPTEDDFGYWVKFNYKKIYKDYKWRAPYSNANFIDGAKNYDNDNKAGYTYGQKEIYILESIETKTHIAVFETSCRKDGYDALNEMAGGIGTQSLQKLDRIKLFTKKARLAATPVPTKVINFEYSYDLCPGVPNNDLSADVGHTTDDYGTISTVNVNSRHGKLTLNKIYFTYQDSKRGAVSPYVFSYGDLADLKNNPVYNNMYMDRWGNYKNNGRYGIHHYPYLDHPYTDQDPEEYTGADGLEPAQWTLKQVKLPTGGTLKIEYDFDDYAYVENKQATRMFDICGMGSVSAPEGGVVHDDRAGGAFFVPLETVTHDSYDCVYFRLEKPMATLRTEMGFPAGMSDADVMKKLYLENLPGGYVYFSIYSKLTNKVDNSDEDYVKGYAEADLSKYGIYTPSGSTVQYGYVGLKRDPLASPNVLGKMVSPFIRRSLEHLRANRQELTTNYSQNTDASAATQVLALVNALPGQITDLMSMTVGFNNFGYTADWGQKIALNGYSTIRLCVPDYKKTGGGVRVKKITLDDNWKNDPSSSSAQNSLYGQLYEYETTAMVGDAKVKISSGVAYEPQVGGEESALRTPIPYKNSIPLHGAYNLFLENPLMEDYYPGAGVGYSKVTVKSIAPERAAAEDPTPTPNLNTLKYAAAPMMIHEFYTPKDFPVIINKTDMNPGQPIRIPLFIPSVITSFKTRQAKSQGYSIILNDMAGKQKAITAATIKNGEASQVISRQKFVYNTESEYNENAVNKLSSLVQTMEIDKSNYNVKYVTSIVGQSHDMFVDMNEDNQEMETFGLETNADLQYTPPTAFIFMIMPIPHINVCESSLKTVVFNKVINRSGILKKVETTTEESTIITENLAFDIQTGEPLLTKVTNEFKDPVYTQTYPAHWYYPNMAGAYQNFGLRIDPAGSTYISSDANGYIDFDLTTPTTNILNGKKVSDYFAKGDYVQVASATSAASGRYHVFSIDDVNHSLLLINGAGIMFPASTDVYSIAVLKSGFKNMVSTKAGSLTFKDLWAPSAGNQFVDYIPSDASTKIVTPRSVSFEDAAHNKIINAAAVEYSNDWQVFSGPPQEAQTITNCEIIGTGYEFLSMMNQLNTAGHLTGIANLYNESSNTFHYGFTSALLNSNSVLTSVIGSPGNQTINYNASIDPSDGVIYMQIGEGYPSVCLLELRPAVFPWSGSILSFDNIYYDPANGVTINATDVSGTPVQFYVRCLTDRVITTACCWDFSSCSTEIIPNYACGITTCQPVNPYWAGMKGMWRPLASHAYHSDRTQGDNIREDGTFVDFQRFPWEDPATKDAKWVNASTVTKYSPFGFELENKDALGNYSSALYGYSHSLLVALGSNAKYTEIAFDNFEDYPQECNYSHFKFTGFSSQVKSLQAHTGKYSIEVASNAAVDIESLADAAEAFVPINDVSNPIAPATTPSYCPEPMIPVDAVHYVKRGDLLGVFSPLADKKYVASVWVKEVQNSHANFPGITAYNYAKLKITVSNGTGVMATYTFSPKGNIIDGWQRIFEYFDIPAGATQIKTELINTSVSGTARLAYFDDIRIHPFDGNMVSYVFDPVTLKLMAELDANNFATIYVYDDEGHLNKMKKETTEGIKTVKEGRVNTKKIYE